VCSLRSTASISASGSAARVGRLRLSHSSRVIAAASAAVWIDGGTIVDAGIALSAVGPTTVHLSRAEELVSGSSPSEELFERAGELATEDCAPVADGRGPVDYKRHLAGVLTKRALRRACARALHQEA